MDMKVAIGTWEAPPTYNGPAYYIKELVERISKYIDVVLIVPSTATVKDKTGLVVRKIGSIDIPIVRVCLFALRASSTVGRLNADLIHDNGVLGFTNFSPFIETWHHANIDDRKYMRASQYYLSFYRELLTLKGIRKADSIIAVSSVAKEELIRTYSIPSSVIEVIPHGVDVDFFRPLPLGEVSSYFQRNGEIYLLYVGGLIKRKNVSSLIRALKLVVNERADVHLLIVGVGSEKNHLQELTANLNLKEYVTFMGSVSRERLLELYNMADYVVQPSYKEGFGMTVLEALACEKPVIMTPTGISEVVKKNDLGVVVDDFTPSSLAIAIKYALDRPKFSGLRKFVTENFSWDKTVELTLQIYKRTLQNR
ncbi:MAG: glycosyltransferase family 4 protein [Candidatus Bathyarchaeia archaeon]|jgi:glycosyltransferase involved in cell wall biosynthesis